jgi:hypothetical protein
MGNRNLISDFECDSCNNKFSKYESDLANFIGVSRSMIYSNRKLPKFKTPDKSLIIEENSNRILQITSIGLENNNFEIDETKKHFILKSVKHSYIPINVYRSLLKIGLSLIRNTEVGNFQQAYKFLTNQKNDKKLTGHPLLRLFIWQFPGPPFIVPLTFVCNKKFQLSEAQYPSKSLVIFFSNYIYQIFYAFNEMDRNVLKVGNKITLLPFPPLIDKTWIESYGDSKFFNIDLSNSDKKINEKQNINMIFNDIEYHNI